MDGSTAYQPPRLDPDDAAFIARLTRRRSPARAGGWEVEFGIPGTPGGERHAFTLAGHPVALHLPADLVEAVLLTLDPAAPQATGTPRRLLLELALEEVLQALDEVLPVASAGPEPDGGALPVAIGVVFRAGEMAWQAVLQASPRAADAVLDALATLEPAPVLPEVHVPLSLRAGSCDLQWAELRAVQPGDVLLFSAGGDGSLLLVAQERLVWQVRAGPDAGGGVAVTSPRHRAAALGVEDWMMDGTVPQPLADAELDELPVRLVFEAGRLEVPVGELSVIGPGHVFAIPGRAGLVDIVSGGRRIGQGELVQVGDSAGVRVLRLGAKAE